MKLIYATGTCALSVHILLEEIGAPYEAERVSLEDKTVLLKYNPKGYVPALVINNVQVLTEAINILQYLAEKSDSTKFLPVAGTLERARCIEWCVYSSTELHKGIGPLFHPKSLTKELEKEVRDKADMRLKFMDEALKNGPYLLGSKYTIADMYTLAILRIYEHVKIKLDKFPNILKYKKMLEALPNVEKVLLIEEKASVASKAS